MAEAEMSNEDLVAHWQDLSVGVALVGRRIDRRLKDAGVPAHWFAVLHLLHGAEDHRLPMSTLAREVSMTSGGFTKLADRMAREGLIDRRGSTSDRRVVHATLTADGLRMATHARGVFLEALRECVLGVASQADLASAAATLGALRAAHESSVDHVPEHLASERSAASPDRRRRGARASTWIDRGD